LCDHYHDSGQPWICEACAAEFLRLPCPGYKEVGTGQGNSLRIFSGWAYDATLETLIHHLKYGRHPRLGPWLGEHLAQRAIAAGFLAGSESLIPVPLHPRRLEERGFNQSERLIHGIVSKLPGCRSEAWLIRTRYTKAQATLSREARLHNVWGAFRSKNLKPDDSQCIVIVDDVLTTGATLSACQQSLREKTNVPIRALTLARA